MELGGIFSLRHVENKEEMLTSYGFAAKTLKHKNNLPSYAGSRDFQSAELFFLHPHLVCEWFLFSGEIPWTIFF